MAGMLKLSTSYSVAFSADSRLLATTGRDVRVWNLESRKKVVRAHPFPHPSSVCFSPCGDELAVKSTSGEIAIISTRDGSLIRSFRNSADGEGTNIQYSACGEFIVDGSWAGKLFVRRASSGQVEFSADFPGEMIRHIHRDASGQIWVLAHNSESEPPDYFSIWRWPFSRQDFTCFATRLPFAGGSALAPDATRLAVVLPGAPSTELAVFDIADGARSSCIIECSGGCGFASAWSPSAEFLGSIGNGNATIFHAKTLEPWRTFALPYPSDIAFSPDGCSLAIGSWEAGVVLPMGDALQVSCEVCRRRNRPRCAAGLAAPDGGLLLRSRASPDGRSQRVRFQSEQVMYL
jgi:WD40 repeat protein